MKLGLTNVDENFYKTIEINTIEELIKLITQYKHSIILEKNFWYDSDYDEIPQEYKQCEYALEIYDNYRE